jgi:hypothetical protein
MDAVRCPMCSEPNPPEQENCKFCGARLKPLLAGTPVVPPAIKVGEGPVKKNTAEFEKVTLPTSEPVQPGEAPTKKNTAELEQALPSWLRFLRESEGKIVPDAAPDKERTPVPESSGLDASDWLSGLGKVASVDDEEAPDWLAGLRGESAGTSAPTPEPPSDTEDNLSTASGDTDWMARLGGDLQTPETISQGGSQGDAESLSGLDSQESKPAGSGQPERPPALQGKEISDRSPEKPSSMENKLPSSGEAEDLPDWLNQLKEKAIDSEPASNEDKGATAGSEIPDWLSNFGSAPGTPESSTGESLPKWMSNLEAKAGPKPTAPASVFSMENPPSSKVRDEIPDWLSQFQADVNAAEEQEAKKDQFELAPSLPPELMKGTEPLPEWLAGIKPTTTPSSGIPALIESDEPSSLAGKEDTAFSMETPDWLSKLKPEKDEESVHAGDADAAGLENLEVSELPSWVQAMRPVESVVAEARATTQEEAPVIERSGPLAGLHGVLPAGPGLGAIRKPPAYSTILQVSEGQQRYAAALERLVSSETQPQVVKTTRLTSNRFWRWLIAGLLILAVGFPLVIGIPITVPSTAQPSLEIWNAFTTIDNLPANSNDLNPPVLVVFDYDPAFSGELEAAAAPLVDYLLLNKAPRLALISTNPTGPALAERFITDKNASPLIAKHNYQAGQQYVNLGYLAGGPAGVLYFAMSPTQAAPFTLDGQPAWVSPSPLAGIQKISDFSAIIVLTDNADTGRAWIEQTRSSIDNGTPLNYEDDTPMLMVISAQAEPMIIPYYDSRQIKGLVTGLAGGESSEQNYVVNANGLAQRYWNSFSAGIFVAMILIITGALWSAVTAWRNNRKETGEGV